MKPKATLAKSKYTVSTDSVMATIEATDENEAARIFARSEKIVGIETSVDLANRFADLGGYCRIYPSLGL